MDAQIRTKPRILKKWIGMSKKKKANYNCHTNFRPVKSDAQTENQLKSHSPFDQFGQTANGQQERACQFAASEAHKRINLANENEPIKEKSGRLPNKAAGAAKETASLFNLLFRSLTSSSSNSNPSNPSDNMSLQNSASNEKLNLSPNNRTADKDESDRSLPKNNNKSFDLKDTKLNLSLSSLQASPQKLAIPLKHLPEN